MGTTIELAGVKFETKTTAAKVIDVRGLSSAQTTTHGGGGEIRTDFFGNVKGDIQPMSVTTKISNTQDIYYKDSSGKENHVRINDLVLPVRPGHEIEFIQASNDSHLIGLFMVIKSLEKVFDVVDYNQLVERIYKIKSKHLHASLISGGITLSVIGYVLYSFTVSKWLLLGSSIVGIFLFFFLYSRIARYQKSFILGRCESDVKSFLKKL